VISGEDLCVCGHERKWHVPCSKCECPRFKKIKVAK
jgi:hypothetical protein